MTDTTAMFTKKIEEKEAAGITIETYTLTGETPTIQICPGDLQVICNVMHDYAKLLDESVQYYSDLEAALYEIHARRCRKIQHKIEEAIGYQVEDALEKCKKKYSKKVDIGEDALTLAARKRREKQSEKR